MKKSLLKKCAPLLLSAMLVCLLCSCGASSMNASDSMAITGNYKTYADRDGYEGGFMVETEAEDFVVEESTTEAPMSPAEPQGKPKNSRKIIYSSWYNISTENYDESIAALDALCEQYGAYYENSETYGDQNQYSNRRANFTIRIPVENYKAFISCTGTLGTVTSSGQNNEDVTEAYFDTEARLESAQLREERILEILKNADKLDDVLMLERELSDVRYEIENYQGTLKKYDSLVSYSTATVNISEVKKVIIPDSEKQTLSQRMSASIGRGFDHFRNDLDDFLVSLSYSLPVLLFVWLPFIIVAIIVVAIVKAKIRKKRAANKATPTASVKTEAADETETK